LTDGRVTVDPLVSEVATRIVECPACGAPLPDDHGGESVTCASCGKVVERAADVRERDAALANVESSHAQAEALYRKLGSPPTLSQRLAAVVANKWLWIVGLPFMLSFFLIAGHWIAHVVEAVYEYFTHARLIHVASNVTIYMMYDGWACLLLVAVFVWSLFGERVDARRDLQAALAAKPPETPGGPARCRQCSAPIEVPTGAFGVRCPYCGADNLTQVPTGWANRANKIAADVQMSVGTAREHAALGRRRVLRAAMWRLPLAAIVALFGVCTVSRGSGSEFDASRVTAGKSGQYGLFVHESGGRADRVTRPFFECRDVEQRTADHQLAGMASLWCDDPKDPNTSCFAEAVFPLVRGDRFRLVTAVPGGAAAGFELAGRDFGGLAALGGYGDDDFKMPLASARAGVAAFDEPIAISGWYLLELTAKWDAAFWPCVDTSGER